MNKLLAWLLAFCGAGFPVLAQTYPHKPVRLIVPQPPGGGADIVARLIGQKLAEGLNQQVVVDNRSGAGGIVGTELVARAQPDGYTLLIGITGSLTITPNLHKNLPYRPVEDFAPISLAVVSPFLLTVHAAVNANSVAELITLAKSKAGPLNYSTPGNGSLAHLSMEWFRSVTGTQFTHVPVQGLGGLRRRGGGGSARHAGQRRQRYAADQKRSRQSARHHQQDAFTRHAGSADGG